MKKSFFILLITIALIGFIVWFLSGSKNGDNQHNEENNIPIFQSLDSFFTKYPNWNNNETTRKAYTDTLNKFLIKRGVKDIFVNVPLTLSNTTKQGDVYMGKFDYESYKSNIISDIDYSFSVFAILDKSAIDTLREDETYILSGEAVSVKEPADIWFSNSVTLPSVRVEVSDIKPFIKEVYTLLKH